VEEEMVPGMEEEITEILIPVQAGGQDMDKVEVEVEVEIGR